MDHKPREVSQWEIVKEPVLVFLSTIIALILLTLLFAYGEYIDKALNDCFKWFSN